MGNPRQHRQLLRVPLVLVELVQIGHVDQRQVGGTQPEGLAQLVEVPAKDSLVASAGVGEILGRGILGSLLDDPERAWKKAAFSQYPRGKIMGYTMRTERFRYTEWQNRKTGEVMARELYDHKKDPHENVNVADEREYGPDIKRLSEMVKQGWRRALPG